MADHEIVYRKIIICSEDSTFFNGTTDVLIQGQSFVGNLDKLLIKE
ncbi:MAG: hypothetical protein AAB656_03340 [Patescibacteria group bacterium]